MIMNPIELLTSTHALLAHQVRLTIMAALASTTEPTEFAELLNTLNLTKGNLSAHTQKLEEAGLIRVTKEFVGRKPRLCTDSGRQEVRNYLSKVEDLLRQTQESVRDV